MSDATGGGVGERPGWATGLGLRWDGENGGWGVVKVGLELKSTY